MASDVQVFSSTPGKRRRLSSGGGGATTAPDSDHDTPASPPAKGASPPPAPRDEPVDPPRASAPARPSAPASRPRPGAVEPIPHSSLAALDEGMMRNMKANRKRARDAQTLLKRAVKLGEIKFFNRLVKDFGNDKQLGFAEEAFRRVADAGLERNVYTYTNMLNACVRVGELDRARRTWSDMLAAGVQPNEVTYTVLVKGLAQEGLLDEAANVVEEMRRAGVEPNARTFSTLLRNCVRHADQAAADRCFAAMREGGTAPDVASFEYLIKTRCAAMDAEGAWAAHAEMEREYLDAPPQAHAALATVSSLIGDETRAREACAAARAAVEANGAGTPEDGGGAGGYGCVGGYGSDSDGEQKEEDDGAPVPKTKNGPGRAANAGSARDASKSVQQFLRLRNGDALRQVADVEAHLDRGSKFVDAVAAEVRRGPEDASSSVRIVEGANDAKGRLDLASLFGNDLPARLEVCSGHGDWVTARAATDAGKGNWLAIEMRRNRVRMTWAKAVRRRLKNLALLRGMAHEMMDAHLPDDSLTEVHVNYPDPPEWVGSSQCLVDEAFLVGAHRTLRKDGGHLTLVTDDPTYAMRMCRELSRLPELFRPTEPEGRPFRTGVPEDYGGSYFDDMWKNGNLRDRYYMRYEALRT